MTTIAINTNPLLRNLAILLAAQLALAAGLLWWQGRDPSAAATRPLFEFDVAAVDRIAIEGPEGARVELTRSGSGDGATWGVVQAGGFPAQGSRVRQLVERLHGLEVGAPVTRSPGTHERFRVTDEAFERRLQVSAGDTPVATLLLGSSQGPRQTSARALGHDEVHAVDWQVYDLPARPEDWIDRTVLRIPKEEVEWVEVGGRRLEGDAAGSIASALAALEFQSLVDAGAKAPRGAPELELQVQRRGAGVVTYTLHRQGEGDERVLTVSGRSERFRLAAWQARPLLDAAQGDAAPKESAG